MDRIAAKLDAISGGIIQNFQEKYAARDKALQGGREVIRHSANAIRAVHRYDLPQARQLLEQARHTLAAIDQALVQHPDVYHAGFVQDAQKEYAEASITLAIVAEQDLPGPEELRVSYAAYLNGAGEVIGELRRQVLDRIRKGEVQRCEALLAAMEDIYGMLVTVDFPDAMTGGLRRTTDAARAILERTRGDLTIALSQNALERHMNEFQRSLNKDS